MISGLKGLRRATSMSTNSDCCAFAPTFFVSFPRIPFPETIKLRIRGFFRARNNWRRTLWSQVSQSIMVAIRVTLLPQLNGLLLKWRIQQISKNAATEATKRPFSHAQLIYFHPGQPGWSVHMSPVNRDPGRRDRDLG